MATKNLKRTTVFALDGEIRYYEGKIGALKLQVSNDEWEEIVKYTVEYCAYIEALKNEACPILNESWDTEDQVYLNELKKTIKQIKKLDPFILAKYNYDDMLTKFTKDVKDRAIEFAKEIKEISKLTEQIVENSQSVKVSEL